MLIFVRFTPPYPTPTLSFCGMLVNQVILEVGTSLPWWAYFLLAIAACLYVPALPGSHPSSRLTGTQALS